jgi:hypothetical protein
MCVCNLEQKIIKMVARMRGPLDILLRLADAAERRVSDMVLMTDPE